MAQILRLSAAIEQAAKEQAEGMLVPDLTPHKAARKALVSQRLHGAARERAPRDVVENTGELRGFHAPSDRGAYLASEAGVAYRARIETVKRAKGSQAGLAAHRAERKALDTELRQAAALEQSLAADRHLR